MFGLGPMEIVIIVAIGAVLLGPSQLPKLAKSLGGSIGEFKKGALTATREIKKLEKDIEEISKDGDKQKRVPKRNGSHSSG